MPKLINLKKAVERKGIVAINILFRNGIMKYDLFASLECAINYCKEGNTYTVEQAVKKFPMYFTYY